jgi:hypothetical protein
MNIKHKRPGIDVKTRNEYIAQAAKQWRAHRNDYITQGSSSGVHAAINI